LLATWILASCSGSIIVDRGDIGAFTYDPGTSWGVTKTRVQIGVPWSAGGILLCKKSQDDVVVLQDIKPVSVVGQVRLDGIGVRNSHYVKRDQKAYDPATHLVGTMRGVPDGLHDPVGFTVDTTCPSLTALVGEIVVTLTKTGSEGGALDGLRVDYKENTKPHELVINFHFGLCGTGESSTPCAAER
jgi:hypothetical protein